MHDVSDGGLLVAIAEMALAGGLGVALDALPARCPPMRSGSARTRRATWSPPHPDKADAIHKAAAVAKVPLRLLGKVGGDAIVLDGEAPLPLATLKAAHEGWLPRFMAHG